jgi:hypothetical protein
VKNPTAKLVTEWELDGQGGDSDASHRVAIAAV